MKRVEDECFKLKSNKEINDGESLAIFSNPPSLKSICTMSIAISLWMKTNPFVHLLSKESYIKIYNALKKNVLQSVDGIPLPYYLKLEVSNVIGPIGGQILHLIDERSRNKLLIKCCRSVLINSSSMYWTMEGTIDTLSLIEKSIKDKIADNEIRKNRYKDLYVLACDHCLENYISVLWKKIPKREKEKPDFISKCYNDHIVGFWTANLNNELPHFLQKLSQDAHLYDSEGSIFQNMVSFSIYSRNVVALKYFWSKLKECERKTNVKKWLAEIFSEYNYIKNYVETEMMCFLFLFITDRNELEEIFKANSRGILGCLFRHWRYRRFFLPTLTAMIPYLDETDFCAVMYDALREIREGKTTHVFIRDVWNLIPIKFKKALSQIAAKSINEMTRLLSFGNTYIFEAIISNLPAEEKKDLIFRTAHCFSYSDHLEEIDVLVTNNLLCDQEICLFRQHVFEEVVDYNCCKRLFQYQDNDFRKCDAFLNRSLHALYEVRSFKVHDKWKNKPWQQMSMYTDLIILGDYERVNQFMIWYFETVEKVDKFKSLFHKVHKKSLFPTLQLNKCIEIQRQMWIRLCKEGKHGWNLFKMFLIYIMHSYPSEAFIQFKNFYLRCVETKPPKSKKEFQFLSMYLFYCFDSVKEIHQFKHRLLLSDSFLKVFFKDMVSMERSGVLIFECELKMKVGIKWFCPLSKEVVRKLKSKLLKMSQKALRDWRITPNEFNTWDIHDVHKSRGCSEECRHQYHSLDIFKLLDSLVEEETDSEYESTDCFSWSSKEYLDYDELAI